MSRTNTLGRYTQSIRPKDICILLVNNDDICCNIVSDMLDHYRYEVFSYEREMDALNIIREKNDEIDLILTNVHRTYAKYGIIKHIEKYFKLQIISMSPDVDGMKNSLIGGGNGVTVYFMKSLSVNEMNTLWATALAQTKSKRELSSGKSLHVENAENKRLRENDDQNGNVEKKPRVVWTKEMHQKFLEAVAQLGHDMAFPKKIVELMNVPGLTRENVASHLQKYRMCMKRAQEGFTSCSSYDFTDSFGFNTEENFQQSHYNPFQMGSLNTFTPHFSLNNYKLRSRILPYTSLLNTIRIKPDHNFREYGDQKKNVLLSIENSNVHLNTSFAGFRLARDGKSVMFGENSHLSSHQQQVSFPEMGNDDSSLQSLVGLPGTVGEPVKFSSQLSSLAALLGVDEPMQPSASPPGFDWNKAASFTEPPSAIMTPPQSAGLQWVDWSESPSGNDANANSEIFSDFTSMSLLSEFCEMPTVGDDYGVDATLISVFDDLLFDNQELTLDK